MIVLARNSTTNEGEVRILRDPKRLVGGQTAAPMTFKTQQTAKEYAASNAPEFYPLTLTKPKASGKKTGTKKGK